MPQYYILNQAVQALAVFKWIQAHGLDHEVHLNRTRFSVPNNASVYTEFALRFSHCCPLVEEGLLRAD